MISGAVSLVLALSCLPPSPYFPSWAALGPSTHSCAHPAGGTRILDGVPPVSLSHLPHGEVAAVLLGGSGGLGCPGGAELAGIPCPLGAAEGVTRYEVTGPWGPTGSPGCPAFPSCHWEPAGPALR